MKAVLFASVAFLSVALAAAAEARSADFSSREYVPNAPTAIAIGRAILLPIYGARTVRLYEPLTAQRHGDTWFVSGVVRCLPVCLGGGLAVAISAKDGRIQSVIRTK